MGLNVKYYQNWVYPSMHAYKKKYHHTQLVRVINYMCVVGYNVEHIPYNTMTDTIVFILLLPALSHM